MTKRLRKKLGKKFCRAVVLRMKVAMLGVQIQLILSELAHMRMVEKGIITGGEVVHLNIGGEIGEEAIIHNQAIKNMVEKMSLIPTGMVRL